MSAGLANLPFAAALAQSSPPQPTGSSVPVAIFVLPFIVVLFIGFAFALRKWNNRRRGADPSCGRCGYLVKGLTTFTCPECGSDLREVGIVRRPTGADGRPLPRSRAAIFFRTVGWQLALVAGVVAVGAALTIE